MPSNFDPSLKHYRPCVGIMVLNRQGLVWIGKRAQGRVRNEGTGSWWQMPQGGIDDNEDPAKAARRELFEETGMSSVEPVAEYPGWLTYELPAHLIPGSWGGRYKGQRQKWFALRFTGPETEINIVPTTGHEAEFSAWQWAPIGGLVDLIVPFKRPLYEQVVAHFSAVAKPAP